jgi:hypothetical protein
MAHFEHPSVWLDCNPTRTIRITQTALKDLCVVSDHRATLVALDTVNHLVSQAKRTAEIAPMMMIVVIVVSSKVPAVLRVILI